MKCFKKSNPLIISFLVFFVEIASKLEKVGPTLSSFNLFPSLPSVATNDRKRSKLHDIVLNNKSRPFFWNSVSGMTWSFPLLHYLS